MFRRLLPLVLLAFLAFSRPVAADLLVDGVPASVCRNRRGGDARERFQYWNGIWVGMRGGSLKHILLVETVSEDGAARAVYAIGDNLYEGGQRSWLRVDGLVLGRTLKVMTSGFSATYEMTDAGALNAHFARGDSVSSAAMAKSDLAALSKPDAVVPWTRGKFEFLQTDLIEDGKPVRLEVVVFRPPGPGPFPLAMINHGSTGRGFNPTPFTQTWFATEPPAFERGAAYRGPTIWLYGHHDTFYSIAHSRDNFAAFKNAGGRGEFLEFDIAAGHSVIRRPKLWSAPIDSYLKSRAAQEN